MGIISTIFGGLLLFPYVVTLIFLIIMRKRGRAPSSVIGLAADITTPFLFITVYIIFRTIIGEGAGVYIIGVALLLAIVSVILERIKVKEFQITRLLRKTWRLYFLVLTVSYVLLLFVGIIMKVIEYLT
ncbi:DUF3397 domain-containing protein [Sporosarcina beigongshangi]|uniref:DUF3397 domain-containing protein n=1 Tax=Sporosarcina beigongshangi TaxID=2782538 RepID=UPI00193A8773|nr:DUF3397 domain-containing protein [Sporosarcina beigongshangi]